MIPVTVKELSAALRQYDIKKRELDPARYEALADFRDFMPDLYPEMGPPPMNEDGTMKVGLVKMDGQTYYFNPVSDGFKGAMITGEADVNGSKMTFANSGELLN